MDREEHQVQSTKIANISYGHDDQSMDVTFHRGGTYRYYGVPYEIYSGIRNTSSPGKFHQAQIVGQYRHERVS